MFTARPLGEFLAIRSLPLTPHLDGDGLRGGDLAAFANRTLMRIPCLHLCRLRECAQASLGRASATPNVAEANGCPGDLEHLWRGGAGRCGRSVQVQVLALLWAHKA